MSARKLLDLDRLRSLLGYEPLTGKFTWLKTTNRRVRAGDEAGCIDQDGYRVIGVDGRQYAAHRLAWLYVHGTWPKDQTDHIDGDKLNNAIANLREATHSENQANRGRQKNNSSGFKGVSWSQFRKKWAAAICVKGCTLSLGFFSCPAEAHRAYVEASRRLHGEFGRAS